MFKRYLSNFKRYLLLPTIGWISFAHFVLAQNADGKVPQSGVVTFLGYNLNDLLIHVASGISYIFLYITNYWVAFTGALLNVSIVMTLHISDFVNSTQGIYLVWETVRDISGMVIIFMLLYASFLIIFGQTSKTLGGPGNVIKNAVIVGILINFSFFITSLLIDASNILSMTIYDAIVIPTTQTNNSQVAQNCASATGKTPGSVNTCVTTAQMMSGDETGISGVFMSYLNPQIIYNGGPSSNPNSAQNQSSYMILIQGVVGSIIQITVGMSFLLAALAFVVRLIVLIFLLAFSPLWFASWVIPELKDKADHFTKQLKAQLIFMPVYLLLLYASLRILSDSTIFTNPSGSTSTSGVSALIVLAINDFFIVFLLNLPLVTAFAMGGVASDWIKTDRFDAKKIWRGVGGWSGRNSLGRAAYGVNDSRVMKRIAALSPTIGGVASKGLSSLGNAGFGQKKGGYKDNLEARKKSQEELYKHISSIDKSRYNLNTEAGRNALKEEEQRVQGVKGEYVENLAPSSILTKMLWRSDRQSASKLGGELKKENEVREYKEAKKGIDDADKKLKEIDESFTDEERRVHRLTGNPRAGEIKKINEEKKKYQATVERLKKTAEEADSEEMLKKLKKLTKEDKEEKPEKEEKPKEEPKK